MMDILLYFLLQDLWVETMKNVNLSKKQGFNMTMKQLKKWKVRFHKLIFGKPSYDIIVDDKSLFFKKKC